MEGQNGMDNEEEIDKIFNINKEIHIKKAKSTWQRKMLERTDLNR